MVKRYNHKRKTIIINKQEKRQKYEPGIQIYYKGVKWVRYTREEETYKKRI